MTLQYSRILALEGRIFLLFPRCTDHTGQSIIAGIKISSSVRAGESPKKAIQIHRLFIHMGAHHPTAWFLHQLHMSYHHLKQLVHIHIFTPDTVLNSRAATFVWARMTLIFRNLKHVCRQQFNKNWRSGTCNLFKKFLKGYWSSCIYFFLYSRRKWS